MMWRRAFASTILCVLGLLPSFEAGAQVLGQRANACPVAREIVVKGMQLYDQQPQKGLAALENAYRLCPTDLAVGYNYGLALFQEKNPKAALKVWSKTHKLFPEHLNSVANLAWTHFELGQDEEAHILAFKSLERFPGDLSLAHTKLFSLFRMGRYLEAYDWMSRAKLEGLRAKKWYDQSTSYVVETLWRSFRRGDEYEALRRSVNMLVKEYPQEAAFVEAKDMLARAHVDDEAEVPIEQPLPHEVWAKQGDVDDRSLVLDDRIGVQPLINRWEKRADAYAVIIGISRYHHLPGRYFSERDARNMANLLVRRGLFINDSDHLRLRLDNEATPELLRKDIQWLLKQGRINPNAMLLFYYSGHGAPYVNPRSGQLEDLLALPVSIKAGELTRENAISLKNLQRDLERLRNREVAVIIDACFSGEAPCLKTESKLKPHHRSKLESARKPWLLAAWDKRPSQFYAPGRQSGLTYFLLRGMLGEADGADGSTPDDWVGLSEAFNYSRSQLKQHKLQMTPWITQGSRMRLSRTGGDR
uniref:Peptidase C14 caspase domain-containing protein n=1 Tax=Magnetococcus massalia (strain MO-1) TaxID=451514 RepID=A0A1S7LNG2_MAGMO|nr:Conserved protein of unknown function. Peptidase C14, caspase catalytic subunit p20 [Candidatus Magnetococcus massalia]